MTSIEKLHPAYVQYLELLQQVKKLREITNEKRKALKEAEQTLLPYLYSTENKKDLHIEPQHHERFTNCIALKVTKQTTYESLGKKKLLQFLLDYFAKSTRFEPDKGEALANDIFNYINNQQKKTDTLVICPVFPKEASAKKRKSKKEEPEEEEEEEDMD